MENYWNSEQRLQDDEACDCAREAEADMLAEVQDWWGDDEESIS